MARPVICCFVNYTLISIMIILKKKLTALRCKIMSIIFFSCQFTTAAVSVSGLPGRAARAPCMMQSLWLCTLLQQLFRTICCFLPHSHTQHPFTLHYFFYSVTFSWVICILLTMGQCGGWWEGKANLICLVLCVFILMVLLRK